MPSTDVRAALLEARRRHAEAIARRDAAEPWTPEYREAVQSAGSRWWRMRRLEDQVRSLEGRDPPD